MIAKILGSRSVQTKLAIVVMIICGTLVLLSTSLFVFDKVFSFRRSMVETHSMLAETIAKSSIPALVFDDTISAEETLWALSGVRDVVNATIYTKDGRIFADYLKKSADTQKTEVIPEQRKKLIQSGQLGRSDYIFSSKHLDLVAPIIFEENQIGYLTIRADLEHLNKRLIVSIGVAIALIAVMGVMAYLASVFLNKFIAKPLFDLLGVMEAVRKEKNYSYRAPKLSNDEFGALSDGFNSMLAEIETRDGELAEYRNHLESEVDKRTKELVLSNEKLQQEVEERKVIQGQLARAQRMEAIGTLAGGVAHDLNNILSGVVSYPELLLMNLPKDHEMYGPLAMIQTSGNKAAAIVQDLLTLARRGGMIEEVVELDRVVNDYLQSPECFKMLDRHPHVIVKKVFSDNLLKIKGSAVHLSKTIMNIVINAAESMVEPGEVLISLQNSYLESPVKGYREVAEGDYVLLKISDTGHGISPEDIDFIFEPFYTRKKMGISGTGLGMAVVWGTIEDHKGYIDVDSVVEQGTTFYLYFPATDKTPEQKEKEDIGKYRGNGESVLVVDDIQEQRIIASAVLDELGYTAEAVSSGEEAIHLLSQKAFDLLILDMIMEPGLDGIETFMKVLEVNPEQRALIASGFSEMSKLEAAKEMGLVGYIRKPYTIYELGKAVREELDRNKEPSKK